MKKISNIQSFRGIAVLLVLFFHMMLMERKWCPDRHILGDFFILGQSGVDLFFVISGFIMFTITRGRFQKLPDIIRFGCNRIIRIYPAYWFYSILLTIVYFLRPALINPTLGHRVNFVSSFLLIPQDTLPLLMVAWTLVYEMYFYFIFALFMVGPEKHLPKAMLLWAAFIIVFNLFENPSIGHNMISASVLLTSPLCLEFIGGCLVAHILFSNCFNWRRSCLAVGVTVLIGTNIGVWLNPSVITIINPTHRLILFGLPYMAIIYGVVAIEMVEGKMVFPFLQRIGDASYSIYLSHTIVINALGWVWANLYKDSSNSLWLFFMSTISIASGLVSYRLVELPTLVFLKKIVPFRN